MKKWKALRDNFVREQRLLKKMATDVAAAKKKKYVYFEQLLFLLPYVKVNDNTVSNIPPPVRDNCNSSEQPETDHSVQTREPDASSQSVPKRKIPLRKEAVKARRGIGKSFAETSKTFTDILAESV